MRVPEGWKRQTVGELYDVQLGKMLNQSAKTINPQYPYLTNFNVRWGSFDLSELNTMHFSDDEQRKFSLKSGDIIMCEGGEVGRCAIWTNNDSQCYFQKALHRLRTKGQSLPEYFQKYMEFVTGTRLIENIVGKTSIAHLTREKLVALSVPTPPLPEQQKIAQILSTWNKAISTTEQLLANSQHQKKALMQQLLTGKKRLLDEDGVRFGEGWKEGNLGGITNIDSGYAFKSVDFTDSEAGVPIIRMSDFKTGGIDISGAAKIKMEATKGLDKFKLRAGDFVFGMSGSLSNYGWVKEQDLPCFLNQRVGRILVKEYSVQLFVTYLYLSDKIQQSILDKAAGAAQLNISVSDLRNTIVQYPNFEEQQKIAIVLSTADREIELLRTKLEALKQEKKALMQQLLTGKRRVKILEVG